MSVEGQSQLKSFWGATSNRSIEVSWSLDSCKVRSAAGFMTCRREKSLKKVSLPSSQHQFEQSTCISHSSLKAFGFPVFHAATPRRCSFCPKDFERVRCSLACKCERKQFSNLLASSIQQGQMACICAACKDLFIYIPDMGRQCCFFQISIFIYR